MTTPTSGVCGCGVHLVPHRTWNKLSREDRAALRDQGYNRSGRTGECHLCGDARRWVQYREANPITFQRRADVLAEWEFLVDHSRTMHANIRDIAPRLGMSGKALQKALGRAGVRAWPVSELGWSERSRDDWAS